MPEDKEAMPNFSNSKDHLSNRARPNSEFKMQCNFLLHSICVLPDLTGCCNVELMDEYKLQMLRTSDIETNHSYQFCLSFCGPNAEHKEVPKIYPVVLQIFIATAVNCLVHSTKNLRLI
jgi:hypothetical protein